MGLFDEQVKALGSLIKELKDNGRLRSLHQEDHHDWPSERTLVMEEDTAVELGHPSQSSLAFMAWTDNDAMFEQGAYLSGPDVKEIGKGRAPFGLALLVAGDFEEDEYDRYRDVKDAIYGVKLAGVMQRAMPSRQALWYRIGREAVKNGFTLAHLAGAVLEDVSRIEYVKKAALLMVTDDDVIKRLSGPGDESGRIAAAMVKMYEEMNYDCDTCDYSDVCTEVAELKKIRSRLEREETT